jgi:hypothetical protein
VVFNQSWWAGVSEGDLLKVRGCNSEDPGFGFLFLVPRDDGCAKHQLQVCHSLMVLFTYSSADVSVSWYASDFNSKACCGGISSEK